MLDEGVCLLLQADQTLNQTLGVGGRVTLLLVPVGPTYPCVSLLNISDVADYAADGPSGYVARRVPVDSWGLPYLDARNVQERNSPDPRSVGKPSVSALGGELRTH